MAKKQLASVTEQAIKRQAEKQAEPSEKTGAKTEPAKPRKKRKWQNLGVPLQRVEIEALDRIAENHEVTRSSLMRFAVVEFIRCYRADTITLETRQSRGRGKVVVRPIE